MRVFVSLLSGVVFGLGLMVSGMTDTQKVRGFLDVFGAWDPTLIFVLGGAVLPMVVAWRVAAKRKTSPMGEAYPGKPSTRLDGKLVLGALLFGVGWGLGGFCPGPAMASLSYGGWGGLVFVVAMFAGMAIERRLA
ncbi:DUF6691 family protein [Thioclava sp. GXIMD4215]|uniref:DUF6691 family protein n=1 Tax=Thioclava sp. GXIMD4215 TaxID=3131928 RepID=UPI0032563811